MNNRYDNLFRKEELENDLKENKTDNSALTLSNSFLNRFTRKLNLFYQVYIRERILLRSTKNTFFRVFGGHIFFQTLAAAVELELFDLLDQKISASLPEIATALGLELQPCRILLLNLTSAGLLRKHKGNYRNSKSAQMYLTKTSEWKFADCVKWQNHINYKALSHLLEAAKTNTNVGLKEFPGVGNTLYQRLVNQPQLEHIFQNAMQEISRLSNDHLAKYIDFSKTTFLIDVGGGNATNIITIAKEHPHLKAVVFDLPSVCKIARENIAQARLTHRLDALEGNIFQDELPRAGDCIIFCHFFTIWSKKENLTLLNKAYTALPRGGRVMIYNMMQHNNQTGPLTSAIGSPYFLTLATGRGMLYTWQEYTELFQQAGFYKTQTQVLPHDHGVIIGTK